MSFIDVENSGETCPDPHLFLDAQGRIWYSRSPKCRWAYSDALIRFDGQERDFFARGLIDNFPGFSVNISTVFERRNGEVWFGTVSYDRWGGLFRLEGEEAVEVSADNLVNTDNINVIAEDAAGVLWIGTGGYLTHSSDHLGGLSSYDGEKWHYYGLREGLADAFVYDLAFGPAGEMWLGTHGGLTRFDGSHWSTYHLQEGLPHAEIHDVLAGPDGRIWVATEDGIGALTYATTTVAVQETVMVPATFALQQNYPNPFNTRTLVLLK